MEESFDDQVEHEAVVEVEEGPTHTDACEDRETLACERAACCARRRIREAFTFFVGGVGVSCADGVVKECSTEAAVEFDVGGDLSAEAEGEHHATAIHQRAVTDTGQESEQADVGGEEDAFGDGCCGLIAFFEGMAQRLVEIVFGSAYGLGDRQSQNKEQDKEASDTHEGMLQQS